MNLRTLTADELLRHSEATDNVLRSEIEIELAQRLDNALQTEIEIELAQRLDNALQTEAALQPIADLLENFGLDADELRQMVELANDRGAGDLKGLTDKLDRADAWYDLATEAGDLFARLEALRAKTT